MEKSACGRVLNGTAKSHLDAIESGNVTKRNVIGIRKALNAEWRRHRGYSAPALSLQGEALREVMAAIHMRKPLVRGDLHESGVKLLTDRRYRKRLEGVQGIIDTLHGFRLCGFQDVNEGHNIPVYEALGETGSFRFYAVPWQSAAVYGLEGGPTVTVS